MRRVGRPWIFSLAFVLSKLTTFLGKKANSEHTGMLLPKITIYQLQDFHLSSRYQNENANRIIFIQHIVTHDACMRS